jgi:tripartite-type tricarboxylate transporter receptor subunit TctC
MPDIKERLAGGGVNVMISKSPEAARQFIQAEIQRWGKVVKDSGTTPD